MAISVRGVGYRFAPNVDGVQERMIRAGTSRAEPEAVAWAQLYTLVEYEQRIGALDRELRKLRDQVTRVSRIALELEELDNRVGTPLRAATVK